MIAAALLGPLFLYPALLRQADSSAAYAPQFAAYEGAQKEIRAQAPKAFLNAGAQWDDAKGEWAIRQGEAWVRYDPAKKTLVPREGYSASVNPRDRSRRVPARGRQSAEVTSPDGTLRAVSRDRNVFLIDKAGKETPVTTDGSAATRIKYGTASWVYGEELEQHEAMWFSPDGKKLAYYRFDESKVPDYYVTTGESSVQNKVQIEAYPKAGAPNPVVDLFVRDLASGTTTQVNVRSGDASHAEYVYAVSWLDAGTLLFSRIDRRQENLEVVRADAATGACRVVRSESNPGGWVDYAPSNEWTRTGQPLWRVGDEAFWISESAGFRRIVAFDLNGVKSARTVVDRPYDVNSILRVDPSRKEVWYEARSASNPFWVQLHRVGFDGKGDVRLTDPTVGHTAVIAEDGKSFLDTAQAWDVAPTMTLRDRDGKPLAEIARATAYTGFPPIRRISCLAADGKTMITGWVKTPAGKGPWPTILEVYGGPEAGTNRERYEGPDARTSMGFAIASVDARGSFGRGRAFSQVVAQHLGGPEIDDMAAFAKALGTQGIADPARVGIAGTSYGGYASAMAILRYPDVFHAAVACSAVTNWRHYDSVYTERYMKEPKDNAAGYDAGAAKTYAKDLKGRLMLYYGTADDNVHPSNTYELTRALDAAGKEYDLRVGVDAGHSGVSRRTELVFFLKWLVGG